MTFSGGRRKQDGPNVRSAELVQEVEDRNDHYDAREAEREPLEDLQDEGVKLSPCLYSES